MKRCYSTFVVFIIALSLLSTGIAWSDEAKPLRHWYRIEMQTGDTTYQCMGSSALNETEFAKSLSSGDFIVLDDVAYLDTTGKIKGWQEWDPKSTSRLYVNPEFVVFFNPMKDDPRKPSSGRK